MTIFKDKTSMPDHYEHVASAMCREDTMYCAPAPMPPRLSGEQHWPERDISHVNRPRRGHRY
jgi:hypothetical protein